MHRILVLIVMFLVTFPLYAQTESRNALGVRLGDSDGFGTELNYQHALRAPNRLEVGLGWSGNSQADLYKLSGFHQWVWHVDGRFNWYAGPGLGVGVVDIDEGAMVSFDDEVYFFLAGVIGIEYDFDFPLLVSLSMRPEIGFGQYRDDLELDLGIGLRYQF
ncbi:hypothetical protein [Aureitalea marina]|uniref:Outer membrane protein beta-barrel domain-containing protein n=1 Tax=Aureitalea marina TaxID=930804 RepID=A0A2S7KP20_9FLAO|nr:hypothetical protein [Aureitalea marina]PQB04365.1 hypothetical protein BST85_05230 [Aureitalea marina]